MEIKIKKSRGFTLIELLVVISIIGLLASVVLVAVNNARQKGRDAKRIGDLTQFAKALELYFNDKFSYPTTNTSIQLSQLVGLTPTYLVTMPATVTPADGSCTAGPGPGTNDYWYYANGGATYGLTFCLGSAMGNLSKGPHTLTQGGFQ